MTTLTSLGLANNNANSTTVAMTTVGSVGAGLAIFVVVMVASFEASVRSVSDTAGNNYINAAAAGANAGSSGDVEVWHCLSATALPSGGTITAALTNSSRAVIAACKLDGPALFIDHGAATGTSSQASASTGGSVATGSVLIGGAIDVALTGQFVSLGGIWSDDFNGDLHDTTRIYAAHGLTSGPGVGTFNPTMPTSDSWACVVSAYTPGSAVNNTSGHGLLF